MSIVDLTGLSNQTACSVIDLYEAGGAAAIKPQARGKKLGSGRSLMLEQEQAIRTTICDKRPE